MKSGIITQRKVAKKKTVQAGSFIKKNDNLTHPVKIQPSEVIIVIKLIRRYGFQGPQLDFQANFNKIFINVNYFHKNITVGSERIFSGFSYMYPPPMFE